MRCKPADTIIKKFKGLKAVSEAAGVSPHTVMRWRRRKEDGGTGGVIPHWHMDKLLTAARERDIDLKPADFLPDLGPSPEKEQA